MKTALMLFPMYGPYHVVRLRSCAALAPEGWTVRGLEIFGGSDGAFPPEWRASASGRDGLPIETLFPSGNVESVARRTVFDRVTEALDTLRPAVVAAPAWYLIPTLAAMEWALDHSTPAITLSASTRWDKKRYPWKETVKRSLVRGFAAGLAGGEPQKAYLIDLGMSPDSVFVGYDVVDNAYFREGVRALNGGGRPLPADFFLTNCRLVNAKNLFTLLRAYREYLDRRPAHPWDLVMVGDGPLRDPLRRAARELGVEDRVHMQGFIGYGELSHYYGRARALVLPSTYEPWGLVVNEAMASGLPVIVSHRCGCSRDLVRHGVNGFLFDPADPAELSAALFALSSNPEAARAMGEASSRVIDQWSPALFGRSFWQAVGYACADRRPHDPSLALRAFRRARLAGLIGGSS